MTQYRTELDIWPLADGRVHWEIRRRSTGEVLAGADHRSRWWAMAKITWWTLRLGEKPEGDSA